MRVSSLDPTERGATLVVALIMLLLFTLLVSGAFSLSMTNLKAVGNTQAREEALASANRVIEEVLSTDFVGSGTQSFSVDINNDGTNDYQINVAKPECIKASLAESSAPSSETLKVLSSATWNTVWRIEATATDAVSEASVKVVSGVRVLLPDAEKKTYCRL